MEEVAEATNVKILFNGSSYIITKIVPISIGIIKKIAMQMSIPLVPQVHLMKTEITTRSEFHDDGKTTTK